MYVYIEFYLTTLIYTITDNDRASLNAIEFSGKVAAGVDISAPFWFPFKSNINTHTQNPMQTVHKIYS